VADKRRPNGEGSVTWDESVQLWVGRLPRDERGRRAKVSDKTEAGALRKLRKKLQEREQGLAVDGRITVKAFLEQWLRDTVLPSGQADQTKEKREIAVRVHLVPGLGRVQLAKLTPAHVQRWIGDELAAGKGPRTVQIAHGTLRLALEQAVLWGLVPRNVARLVKPPAYSAGEQRPFTPAEQAAILDAARSDPLHVMVVLAQATGLRQSELLGLRWSGVDLEGRVLRVDKQLGRDGRLKNLKTAAGRRALPLPSPVVDVLRGHREEQDRQRGGGRLGGRRPRHRHPQRPAGEPAQRAPVLDPHPRAGRGGAPRHPSPPPRLRDHARGERRPRARRPAPRRARGRAHDAGGLHPRDAADAGGSRPRSGGKGFVAQAPVRDVRRRV